MPTLERRRVHPARSATAPEPTGPPPAAPARDPWLDNARLLAAVLIVLGHFLTRVNERSEIADMLWNGTWAFRIPVYVFIAGWFSAGAVSGRSRSISLLRNVFFVYLAFDLIGTVRTGLVDEVWRIDPTRPSMGMWFLFSLLCWRLLLPVVRHVRYLLLWATAAAVLVGFIDSVGHQFSASRTVALFPLFVLGAHLRDLDLRRHLEDLRVRVAAAGVVATVFVVGCAVHEWPTARFLMRRGYRGSWEDHAVEAVVRLGLLGVAAVAVIALLALVPRRRIPGLTYLGSGSMYIYLLHLLVVQQLASMGYFDTVTTPARMVLMAFFAIGLALLLATPPVRRITRPLVQPRFTWPFVPERSTDGAGKATS